MKLLKPRIDLVFLIFVPILVLCTVIYYFFFNHFNYIAQSNWGFTLLLLGFIALPRNNYLLGTTQKPVTIRWFLALLACQLLINLLAWSFAQIISINPLGSLQSISVNVVKFSLASGLFPWGFVTCFAVSLGYFTYHKSRLGLLSSTFEPLFHQSHLEPLGVAVDSYGRLLTIGVFILMLMMLAYSCLLLIQNIWHFPLALGMRLPFYLASGAILMLFSHPEFIKILHKILFMKIPSAIIFLGLIALITFVYPILSSIGDFLVSFNPSLDRLYFDSDDFYRPTHILIMLIFWWFIVAAVGSAGMVYFSQGKTLRQFVIVSLITFLISLGVIQLLERLNKTMLLPLGVMVFCCVIVVLIMMQKHFSTYFLRATLPSKQHPIKARTTFRFLRVIPLVFAAGLFTYLGLGVTLWSYLIVLVALPPLVLTLMSFVGFLKRA